MRRCDWRVSEKDLLPVGVASARILILKSGVSIQETGVRSELSTQYAFASTHYFGEAANFITRLHSILTPEF
jgi:hypothetical protein